MTLIELVADRLRNPPLSQTDIYVVKTMLAVGSPLHEIAQAFGYSERQIESVSASVVRELPVS